MAESDPVAERAFRTLANLKPQQESNIPFCLKGSTNRYCYVCGFRTKDLSDFIAHRMKFHDDKETTLCCFCSMKFADSFSRYMHQMVIVYSRKCNTCLENMTPIHVCSGKSLEESQESLEAFHCTLGCDLRMKFLSKEDILAHLSALHGVDAKDVSVDEPRWNVKANVNSGMEECPECGILVNSEVISLAHHIIHECFARGRLQSVFVRYINDLAESQRMDPELILRFELISQILGDRNNDDKEEKDLDELDITTLFLSWAETLNGSLSAFNESHIDFVAQLYSKNLMDSSSDANFRKNPVPISYNISEIPSEYTLFRLKQELADFNKENVVPTDMGNVPTRGVLIRVAEELGRVE